MSPTTQDDILISIRATPFRRYSTVILLIFFAVVLLQLGIELTAERALLKIAAFGLGIASCLQAVFFWRATGRAIELTSDGILRESGPKGRIITTAAQIDRLDTTAFAYRPASGFLIHLKSSGGYAVAPGMWWRRGKRVGIGGVTAKSHGKMLATALMQVMNPERG